jgi:hypothetical protein
MPGYLSFAAPSKLCMPIFNPSPRPQLLALGEGVRCIVVDDALTDPHAWRQLAIDHAERFDDAAYNAFPGVECVAPPEFAQAMEDYFAQIARRLLGGKRTLRSHVRYAMVTRPESTLEPRQTIAHRDTAWVSEGHLNLASVLYLFDNPALGGTAFFRPRRSRETIARLVHDSGTMETTAFEAQYRLPRRYMRESNRYFDCLSIVPAAFNRLIFYDGGVFHSGAVGPAVPPRDIAAGRLTINGFYTCSRTLGG